MKFGELIQQYQMYKLMDREKSKEAILLMRELTKQEDDEILYARFAYYEGEYLYYDGKLEEAFFLIQEHCLPILKKKKYIREIILAYNLLGIISQTQYEYLNAIDFYLDGLDLSTEHNEYRLMGNIYNNISNIFEEYEDYDRELDYLFMSMEAYDKGSSTPHEKMVMLENIALTYCRVGSFDEAKKYYEIIKTIFDMEKDKEYLMVLNVLACSLARNEEDKEKCEMYVKEILDLMDKGALNMDNFKEVVFVTTYTSYYIDSELTIKLFDKLDEHVQKVDHIDFEICLYDAAIAYYLNLYQMDKVNVLTLRYYELSKIRNYRSKKLMLESVDTKFKVYQLTKDNLKARANMISLKVKSELDPLTKLLNRSALETVLEDWFETAKKEKTAMAVEIIDVDYFKQFNDTYGHIQGDTSLKMLAEVMDRMQGENILFIRYGGDEFLAFYLNHSKEKVLSLAKLLKSEIRALNIEHSSTLLEEKKLSITQGIYYAVPEGEENIFDFIRKCDDSLYEGKITRSSIIFNERQK